MCGPPPSRQVFFEPVRNGLCRLHQEHALAIMATVIGGPQIGESRRFGETVALNGSATPAPEASAAMFSVDRHELPSFALNRDTIFLLAED